MSDGSVTSDERILAFLDRCAVELADRADRPEAGPEAAGGAAAFAAALERSTPLEFEPSWLPVLDTLELLDDDAFGFAEVASMLPWTPTIRASDSGTDFALAPLHTVRDFGNLVVGIMYVRPGAQYPLHQHPPQELYLTLAGEAQWRSGGHDGFRSVEPGRTLYNHPDDLHSSIAGERPLVALYVLW